MRNRAILALLLALLMTLTGCAAKEDTLRFTYQQAEKAAEWEMNLGNSTGGAVITAELWHNGEMTQSELLEIDRTARKLTLSGRVETNKEAAGRINVHLGVDGDNYAGMACFDLPPGNLGYSFSGYQDRETLKVKAGDAMILGAWSFDLGDGVRVVDCQRLMESPEYLTTSSCTLVVRATFTEGQSGAR